MTSNVPAISSKSVIAINVNPMSTKMVSLNWFLGKIRLLYVASASVKVFSKKEMISGAEE